MYLRQFEVEWRPYPTDLTNSDTDNGNRGWAPDLLTGGRRPFLKPGSIRGRKYIIIDEWGPYDFLSPKLVWRGKDEEASARTTAWG